MTDRLAELKRERDRLKEELLFGKDGFLTLRFYCMAIERLIPTAKSGTSNKRSKVKLFTIAKRPSDTPVDKWRYKQQWQSKKMCIAKGRVYRDMFGEPSSSNKDDVSSTAFHTSRSLGMNPNISGLTGSHESYESTIADYHRRNGETLDKHAITIRWDDYLEEEDDSHLDSNNHKEQTMNQNSSSSDRSHPSSSITSSSDSTLVLTDDTDDEPAANVNVTDTDIEMKDHQQITDQKQHEIKKKKKKVTVEMTHSQLWEVRKPQTLLSMAKSQRSELAISHLPRYEVVCKYDGTKNGSRGGIPAGVCIARYLGVEYTQSEFNQIYEHTVDEFSADMYAFNGTARVRGSSLRTVIDGWQLVDARSIDEDVSDAHLYFKVSSVLNGNDNSNVCFVHCDVDGWPSLFVVTTKRIFKGDCLVNFCDAVNACMGRLLSCEEILIRKSENVEQIRRKHHVSQELIKSILHAKPSSSGLLLQPYHNVKNESESTRQSPSEQNINGVVVGRGGSVNTFDSDDRKDLTDQSDTENDLKPEPIVIDLLDSD